MRPSVFLVLLVLVLGACGTKGPLYLPSPEQTANSKNDGKNDAKRNP